MPATVAIVGSGPTAIYCLKQLLACPTPLDIKMFERASVAGRGMPYSEDTSSSAMLANIASIEIPPIVQSLVEWLASLGEEELAALNVRRAEIDERRFFPRLLLGAYFEAQLQALIAQADKAGHGVEVLVDRDVTDVLPTPAGVTLEVTESGHQAERIHVDYAVLATGHSWPDEKLSHPGFLPSPWPAENIWRIAPGAIGIIGTSLSALDVMSEIARCNGLFYHDQEGGLVYRASALQGAELSITLMSRKGILPEADFYCPLPAEPPAGFPAAIEALKHGPPAHRLDRAFDLFFEALRRSDPDYCASLGLLEPAAETFASAYFAAREAVDPLYHAAANLTEARANQTARHKVAWRYAILSMHEQFGSLVPFLDEADQARFHHTLKPVFADNYATVPHAAIERLLALNAAGILKVIKLGDDYVMDMETVARGARFEVARQTCLFDTVLDATGQQRLNRQDLPFPGLRDVLRGLTPRECDDRAEPLAVTADFRVVLPADVADTLYCLALPYLIDRFPFIQGITSSRDLGERVARSILERAAEPVLLAPARNVINAAA